MQRRGFEEKLRLARIVLNQLQRAGQLRRTELEKRTVKQCGTHATFEAIFRYLLRNGYVEKTSNEFRAPYRMTEKGKKFLEALDAGS